MPWNCLSTVGERYGQMLTSVGYSRVAALYWASNCTPTERKPKLNTSRKMDTRSWGVRWPGVIWKESLPKQASARVRQLFQKKREWCPGIQKWGELLPPAEGVEAAAGGVWQPTEDQKNTLSEWARSIRATEEQERRKKATTPQFLVQACDLKM